MPSREEAMMEGTRMLIENLREKILLLEENREHSHKSSEKAKAKAGWAREEQDRGH